MYAWRTKPSHVIAAWRLKTKITVYLESNSYTSVGTLAHSRNWKLIQLHWSDYNIIMLSILLCNIMFSVILSSFYLCVLHLPKASSGNCKVHTGRWYSRIFMYCLAWMWTALKRKKIPWRLPASTSNLPSHAQATCSLYLDTEGNMNWAESYLMQKVIVFFFFFPR